MYIDKSTINFTNGKQFCGNKTKMFSEKKNQTPVRGQDGKISDTCGKDFYWSPTLRRLVGEKKSFPWVSEIFPSCPLTGVRSFISKNRNSKSTSLSL
jgi:hypothetical protein